MTSHYESLLNRKVSLWEYSVSKNEFGEEVEKGTLEYIESGVKCRLENISEEDLVQLPGEWTNVRYKMYMLSSQSLNNDNVIKFNDNVFEVYETLIDSSNYVKKAWLRKIDS